MFFTQGAIAALYKLTFKGLPFRPRQQATQTSAIVAL
jgi:hypothetical protein